VSAGAGPAAAAAPGGIQTLIYLRDLLRELVVRDLKLRYERSVLGRGGAISPPFPCAGGGGSVCGLPGRVPPRSRVAGRVG